MCVCVFFIFKIFFSGLFCFCLCVFFCWFAVGLFCVSVATGVPGREALAGWETVEGDVGTAGIVGWAGACACGAAKP